MKKNIYLISGFFVLVAALSAGLLVPYQSTVMRCSSDDGKTFDIISRLDEYLLNSPKFYNRIDGEWHPGNRKGGKSSVVTEVRDRSAFQTVFSIWQYFTVKQLETIGLSKGDEALRASTTITDFVAKTRRGTGSYISTVDLRRRTEILPVPDSIFFTQPCRID
jgi:hypothetical protein